MASFNKFQAFVADIANKVHNLGSDQLMVALSNTAPVATNTLLTNITEITYTFLSTRVITLTSSTQSAGLYKLILTNLVLTSTGGATGPLRYIVLYNNTAASKNLIGWYDYGSSITLADGETLTISFDATNGVISLT
jgi:hypothetical protein